MTVAVVALAVAVMGCGAHRHDRPNAAGGLRLTAAVPAPVLVTCGEAAQATPIRVVCPSLVPAGGVVDHGPQITARDVYTMSFNNGQVPGHIHWEVGAGTLEGVATAEFDERDWDAPAPKQPARLIGARRCAGLLVMLYRFPQSDGQLEGHDIALATVGPITYFASIHGYSHDGPDVDMLLAILRSVRADHVTRVGPAVGAGRAVVAE